MNHKKISFIGLVGILLLSGQSYGVNHSIKEYCQAPWVRTYEMTFAPDWSLLPSLKKTRELFASAIDIPSDAREKVEDASISFTLEDAKVTLFCNGVMRTEKSNASAVEFFDVISSVKFSLASSGKITSTHIDKKLLNTCAISIEDGGVVCKSIKKDGGAQQRLNCLIRLSDGVSTTFSYLEDGTIVVRDSTGIVEVIPPMQASIDTIMKSHSMLALPPRTVCSQTGLICQDGNGITCYAVDGIRMHLSLSGKLNICMPVREVVVEGGVSVDEIHTRWVSTSSQPFEIRSARLEGIDILFDKTSGCAMLCVNTMTLEVGEFLYDNMGHYCKRNGTGCLRYGLVNPLLTYDGVMSAVARSPHMGLRTIGSRHPLLARFVN